MAKTILVVGYGPGISSAVAQKFGAEGFQVALVARNKERLDAGVKALEAKGVKAAAFVADAGDPAAIAGLVEKVRAALGPVTALHWNAYGGGPKPLAEVKPADFDAALTVATKSLVAAVQATLPDLEANKGAVLVTNGGFGFFDPNVDKFAASAGFGLLAAANSAKHKLVGVLHHELAPKGVYVADVVVTGSVKGTAWDQGDATLEPSAIADRFWALSLERKDATTTI
ncbi:MAG: SDR family NAD(P)-dependent oxidoreductase [Labilithrix sp.]|nr:SDR family NAD(P)-dependent oxidoreductase [Labilithrix sp.]MCW5815530.1 SDR family NAD(P)-dependent oxidoreductase [Labilithrix sp.]